MEIGDRAKDFVLKNNRNSDFRLSSFTGQKILLSFHPLAWTSICAQQMQSLETNAEIFDAVNTIAVGVSVDAPPSKNAWAQHLSIEHTPLLSDFWPHGQVAKTYGLFREKDGFSERANIIIDENQTVIFYKIYEISHLPDIAEIISFLRKMQ